MDWLPKYDNPLDFVGTFLLVLGILLVLGGFGIASLEPIKIKGGRPTWLLGIVLFVIGLGFLSPHLLGTSASPTPTPAVPSVPTLVQSVSGNITATVINTSNILLQDSFIDNRNGWTIQDTPEIQSEIVGGKYSNIINCPSTNTPETCNYHLSGPDISLKDFRLEIDAAISKNRPDGQVFFGIDFRKTNEFYYVIYFKDNLGMMNLVQNTNYSPLVKETEAPTIDLSDGAVNRYGFIANETQFQLLANGQTFATAQDGTVNQAGRILLPINCVR